MAMVELPRTGVTLSPLGMGTVPMTSRVVPRERVDVVRSVMDLGISCASRLLVGAGRPICHCSGTIQDAPFSEGRSARPGRATAKPSTVTPAARKTSHTEGFRIGIGQACFVDKLPQ
jgi:hypothetical protein